jgi:hypothetical protein
MSKETDPQLFESGYERNRLDRYWTHPWMTQTLIRELVNVRYRIPGVVWECAAGRGDISRALTDQGMEVYSSDIDMSEFDNEIGPGHEGCFLDEFQPPDGVQSIVTNPPYNEPWRGISDDFIRQGIGFLELSNVVFMAMLLRSEFRSGKSRKDLFGECPHYMGELVLTTRPRWDYGDPDAPEEAAPRHNFSWFLWHRNYRLQHGGEYLTPSMQIFSYMPKGFKP